MVISDPHGIIQKAWKMSASWYSTPPSPNLIYCLSPTAALEQSLRALWDAASWAAVLNLPQIKLNSQFSSCTSFFINSTYRPGEFIFQCPTFLPCHTVHGVLKARMLKWLPFPSPVDHVLSELSTMTLPFWVALHSMAHNFTELDKTVVHVIRLVSFLRLWFSSCCPLMEKDKRLMEVSWWDRLTEGEIGSCSDGRGHAQ